MSDPQIEGPTPEVERPEGDAAMPGANRSYRQLPTAPVDVAPIATGPDADTAGVGGGWEPSVMPEPEDKTRLAPWALVAAIVALATSMFVGWGIPVAIIAVVAAIMSLRRPVESRMIAGWALVLGIAATVFSLAWLLWAAMQFQNMG